MSYCVVDDIKSTGTGRLPVVTKDIEDDKITGYITGADALINGKSRKRFSVPFDPIPALIKEISIILTCAWVLRDTQQNYEDEKVTDPRAMEKQALLWLDQIVSGEIDIEVEPRELSTLASVGIGLKNIPIHKEDETEANVDKRSSFYLPSGEEPPE